MIVRVLAAAVGFAVALVLADRADAAMPFLRYLDRRGQ